MRLTLWLEELRDDVKFAFRQLRRAPAFTLVAVLTLALGIGANSAIFALVDATLLRPLPYGDPDRLVTVWESTDATTRGLRVAAEHARLERAQPHVRDDRRLHAERRRHGDGRRATATPKRCRGSGSPPASSTCWRQADRRPHVPAQTTSSSAASVVVMSEAFWRDALQPRPVDRRPRDPARRHALYRRRRRAEGLPDPRPHAACGRCGRSRQHAAARARRPIMLQVVGRMKPGVAIAGRRSRPAGGRRRPGA